MRATLPLLLLLLSVQLQLAHAAALVCGAPPAARSRAPAFWLAASDASPALLTREDGKNGKLRKLLVARGVPTDELPCIAFERLPACSDLEQALRDGGFGWVIITSPESAAVFLDSWRASGSPAVRVASVGAGTARVLADAGLEPQFVPSKATAKTLAAELPGEQAELLYPASALASDTIVDGLLSRGMQTRRLDTYTAVPASWNDESTRRAREASVVTFASPSAVRVWAERVGTDAVAVCIGETSAAEATKVGFGHVRYPDAPGLEAWADEVAALWAERGE